MIPHQHADQMYYTMVHDLHHKGVRVPEAKDKTSIGSNFGKGGRGSTVELIGYTCKLGSCMERIIYNPARHMDIGFALAQSLWILSTSDTLDRITPYNPRGGKLAEDDGTLWGAYGRRLNHCPSTYYSSKDTGVAFSPNIITQIYNTIGRLKEDHNTRRAGMVIWMPHDTLQSKKDMPCTFALHCMIRTGVLDMTVMMRSQSSVFVFPYDLFFFTFLQEFIARCVGVLPGTYTHFCSSLHYYESELDMVHEILDKPMPKNTDYPEDMPVMPHYTDYDILTKLLIWEEKFRGQLEVQTEFTAVLGWVHDTTEQMDEYWKHVCMTIAIHAIRLKHGNSSILDNCVTTFLPSYYGKLL